MIGLEYTILAGGIFILVICWEDVALAKILMNNGIYSPREYPKKYAIPSKRIRKIYRIRKYKIPKFALLYLHYPFWRIGMYIGELVFVIIFHEEEELCRGLNYTVVWLNSLIWFISTIFLCCKRNAQRNREKERNEKRKKKVKVETYVHEQEVIHMFEYKSVNVISPVSVPLWGNKKQYIAIHYLGVVGQSHELASDGTGAHYYIYWDGTIYQRCSHDAIVWAVGTAGYYTQKHPHARNANTISIELCCKCDGDSASADDPKWYLIS